MVVDLLTKSSNFILTINHYVPVHSLMHDAYSPVSAGEYETRKAEERRERKGIKKLTFPSVDHGFWDQINLIAHIPWTQSTTIL